VIAWAAHRWWRARREAKVRLATQRALVEALHAMVVDLRAGAPPALAAESAAADAPDDVARLLRALAGAARLGGEPATGAPDDEIRRRLVRAWSLSQRHGLPLAELLDAVRRDLGADLRFTSQTEAAMSGPRASAMVLAALPTFGLLLGEGMGAQPVRVLFGTPAGNALLLLGTVLIVGGAAWSNRITRRGVS